MLTLKAARDVARTYGFSSLITQPNANAKLAKSEGWYNAGITLAQSTLSGFNMCTGSTIICVKACLGGTGRAEFTPKIVMSRIARTKLFATDQKTFWSVLEPELWSIDRKAEKIGIPVAFRPNILSDQSWHLIFPQLFSIFCDWQFYSYTKIKAKVSAAIAGKLPDNYHVTYSWSERCDISYVRYCIENGINVAVPFYDKKTLEPTIPSEWKGFEVVNGDKDDLRFKDPKGVIVGLKVKLPKSKAKRIKRIKEADGFFVGV